MQIQHLTNNMTCLGSPFKCDICKADEKKSQHSITDTKQITARGEGLKEVVLGAPAFFEIDTKGLDGFIDIRITGMLAVNKEKYVGINDILSVAQDQTVASLPIRLPAWKAASTVRNTNRTLLALTELKCYIKAKLSPLIRSMSK